MIKVPKPTLYWIGTKTTVFQIFSRMRHIDNPNQDSSFRETTTYGLEFFNDFLENLRNIACYTEKVKFNSEHCRRDAFHYIY